MRIRTSAVAALFIALVSCQSSPRLTLYRAGSTPVDRTIAYNDCKAAYRPGGESDKGRPDYIKRCMTSKGYTILEHIPVCPTAEERRRALQNPQPRKVSMMTCASGVALDQ